jgi:hypothetical protein
VTASKTVVQLALLLHVASSEAQNTDRSQLISVGLPVGTVVGVAVGVSVGPNVGCEVGVVVDGASVTAANGAEVVT